MAIKELLQLLRDTALLGFLVYAFTLDIYLAGSGVSLELKNATLVVHDADHSFASRELIHRFRPPYFRFKGELENAREGLRLLDRGEAMVMLDIPPRFQESLLQGQPTSVQMQVDASNSVLGFLAASYGAQIVGRFGLEVGSLGQGLTADSRQTVPLIRDEHRVWYNPNHNEAWFTSIAELLTVITLFAILLPAAAMVREKERGTVEQLLVSPLTPFQIMFPKVLAMTVVILAGTAISVFAVMQPFFQLPIKGSLALFFVLTTLYTFTTAGFLAARSLLAPGTTVAAQNGGRASRKVLVRRSTMGTINFSEKEQGLLVEILEREIPDLRDEIWHTDDHDYREALKERERSINVLLDKLKGNQ
jgi:ABC-2 type transport system permease protein